MIAVIEPGQTVALVGATGSGKSTLISLLPRLHDPPPGTVFIDGVDVRDIPLRCCAERSASSRRSRSSSRTRSAANVAFGPALASLAAATRDRARARQPRPSRGSTRTSPTFRPGYDTTVGERGITLSGGQKQRTALARAVALDPRILVLDDALSAVDTYTEEEILSRLRGVMRQRTSIIVSHRDLDRARRRPDPRARRRADRRARHARRTGRVTAGCTPELYRQQLLEEELQES